MSAEKAGMLPSREDLRVAVLASGPSSGSVGGAERHFQGLLEGLRAIGCASEFIYIPADEPSFEAIIENYARCAALDLSHFDVVISTKAPTYAIRHPSHVMHLIHTVRVFDDMFDDCFPNPTPDNFQQRFELHALEFDSLVYAKARFANGKETADRLYRWRGLRADVLHPPLVSNAFRQGPTGDYFFLPGRLHRWKRVDLAIQAVLASAYPLKFKIAGTGEEETELKRIARGDPRIEFLGRIDDNKLVDLYAGALAVPFMPLREDFGYITLEAFASGKPVVTCTDSGEPTRLVRHGENGFICRPDPLAVKAALESLYLDRELATEMGRQGVQVAAGMPGWPEVAEQLIAAALAPKPKTYETTTKVCVLDMQPIDPPVGGGRLRLLGLYHDLGADIDCTYVGTYDWPGEKYRSHKLGKTLREIDVPLSNPHFAAAAKLAGQSGGKVVIDLAFSQQAHLSPDYLAAARKHIANADVSIFSHPWVYPLVKDRLRPDQVLIYDSQNVEGYLRAQLLDEGNPVETELLRRVVQDENDVGWAADWILACSHEDLLRFNRVYGFPLEKMRVVPNGVMAYRDLPSTPERRLEARRTLGIDAGAYLAIFIGSPYGPNVQAADFIAQQLAPLMPHVTFVIAGGVSQGMKSNLPNVRITGHLDEADKTRWLYACDIAVNPMVSGSGTNIKMFEFMAMGLPVVTTAIGARGIETGGRRAMWVVEATAHSFSAAIEQLQELGLRRLMGREARRCVEDGYSWERISTQLGCFIEARRRLAGQSKPLFSVVVPTYERHNQLDELVAHLQKQIERDFEVVLIDQSTKRWPGAERTHGFPFTYYHSPIQDAVRARNTGAMLAQGTIIAFVDDDSRPAEDWLVNARAYFADPDVVGVEGLILSDHLHDPDWRPVTNVGFEGIAFMTGNLFVRSGAFQYLGGFDLGCDRSQFREDTELGWRLLKLGKVPYSKDVRVFQPAQLRNYITQVVCRHPLQGQVTSYRANIAAYKKCTEVNKMRVAHLTTTGIKCGIGEYTKKIIHEYQKKGIGNLILNCECAVDSIDSIPVDIPSRKAWYFDNKYWLDSHIKSSVFDVLKDWKATQVIIQYHPGFYSPEILQKFVMGCIEIRLKVVVITHKYIERCSDVFKILNWFRIPIFSHGNREAWGARKSGVFLEPVPHGIDEYESLQERSTYNRDWLNAPPIIVTNGFLRKHKGFSHLIKAMPMVIRNFPGAKLIIQSPLYPSEDSQEELDNSLEVIQKLQLENHVITRTDFLDKAMVLKEIAKADLAVYPYDLSNEGSSGAAADAISVGLPLIISNAEIFDEIRGISITSIPESNHLAKAIITLLQSPVDYKKYTEASTIYAKENCWGNIADRFLTGLS